MSTPSGPSRPADGDRPSGPRISADGTLSWSTDPVVGAAEVDDHGVIYYPGDEEAQRAPGSALVLLVLSLVAGGLYVWLFWPQKASFDWASAITLKTPELAVLGGVVMWFGGVLFIRHGLIWAIRLGAVLTAVPMARMLGDAIMNHQVMDVGAAALSFVLSGGPALIVLGLTFAPAVARWRRRRHAVVAEQARERKAKLAVARSRRPGGLGS